MEKTKLSEYKEATDKVLPTFLSAGCNEEDTRCFSKLTLCVGNSDGRVDAVEACVSLRRIIKAFNKDEVVKGDNKNGKDN